MNRDIVVMREVVVKLTQLLGGMGLRVTQQGMKAFVETDPVTLRPRRVNVPYIPDDATEELILAIQGFIDHEVAHILFTDWAVVIKATKKGERMRSLHNIVEDTFIEREIGKKFPGSVANLNRLHGFFLEKITQPALDAVGGDLKKQFAVLLVPAARAWSGQQVFEDFMRGNKHWDQPLIKALSDGLTPKQKALFPKIKNSQEAYDLAEAMYAILYPPPPAAAPPPPAPAPSAPTPPPPPPPSDDDEEEEEQEPAKGDTGDGTKPHEEKDETEDKDKEPAEDDAADDAGGDADAEPEADDDAEEEEPGADGEDAKEDKGKPGSSKDPDPSDDDDGDDGSAGDTDEPDGDDTDPGDNADGGVDEESSDPEGSDGDEGEEPEDEGDAGSSAGEDENEDEADSSTVGSDGSDSDDGDGEDAGDAAGESGDEDAEAPKDAGQQAEAAPSPFQDSPPEIEENSFENALEREITDAATRQSRDAEYIIYSRDFDKMEVYEVPKNAPENQIYLLDEETRHMVGKMQKDVERMMAARSQVLKVPGFRSGKLNSSSLHRLRTGDDRIYRRVEETKAKETAVTLLVDNSGSMAGDKMKMAMKAAYALSMTLERVAIPHEIFGFTTLDERSAKGFNSAVIAAEQSRIGRQFSRLDPIYYPIYKTFEERLTPTVKKRIAHAGSDEIYGGSSGYGRWTYSFLRSNIDGEAIQTATQRILRRRERRKVLIVLSDGQPAGRGVPSELYANVHRAIDDASKAKVETIGIGIEDDAVKDFYPRYIVLDDLQKLPQLVMGQLQKILLAA